MDRNNEPRRGDTRVAQIENLRYADSDAALRRA